MTSSIWVVVVLGGLGTYAARAALLLGADRLAAAPLAQARALRMIPPAVLGALVGPGLLRAEGSFDPWSWPAAVGVLAGLVAWRTRSVAITMVGGLALLTALQV